MVADLDILPLAARCADLAELFDEGGDPMWPDSNWIRMEDGAVLGKLTEWEFLRGADEVKVESKPSYAIVFGNPALDPDVIWSDRTMVGVTAVDLRHACDHIDAVIGRFG